MTAPRWDIAVIGGGIIGLSSALHLTHLYPKTCVVVLEKEPELALHQTGHNSGVIHSGVYYKQGSRKAVFCVEGVKRLKQYCQEKGIPYDQCGKVIVATNESELPGLQEIYRRGTDNGVPDLRIIGTDELAEIEPHTRGIKALHVPGTAVVDFNRVSQTYADDIRKNGGEILTGHKLLDIQRDGVGLVLQTNQGDIHCRHLINCAGLHSDTVARALGGSSDVRIIPFRGEYYVLRPESRSLVRGLVYPVPDPRFPFLGVHYTKRINGEVEAGPNAVLAWAREGYQKSNVNLPEAFRHLTYTGFWRMALRTWRVGMAEMHRSVMKSVFVKDLQKLIPEISSQDLVPGGAGVRAQAVSREGALLDDFSIQQTQGAIHVLNAPSPGATSSLSIGAHIAHLAGQSFTLN